MDQVICPSLPFFISNIFKLLIPVDFEWGSTCTVVLSLSFSLYRFFCLLFLSLYEEAISPMFVLFATKRLIVLCLLAVGVPILMIYNHIGFFLDDILFPGWRATKMITSPVFIVGNARSGTTWIHRTLTSSSTSTSTSASTKNRTVESDGLESQFTAIQTWELLFAPSVTYRRMFLYLYRVDKSLLNGTVYDFICYIDDALFRKIVIHPVGLFKAEEDEWLMVHIGLSQLILFFFPLGGKLMNPLVDFDKAISHKYRIAIIKYYRDCIKRHYHGRQLSQKTIYVSKNPAFTMRLATLLEVFPDAKVRIIYM